jgi:hypothetical protein
VICGPHDKRIELGAMPPSHEPLEVLPRIALEAAHRIAQETVQPCRGTVKVKELGSAASMRGDSLIGNT